jgi:histidine triad (HIT) family protein
MNRLNLLLVALASFFFSFQQTWVFKNDPQEIAQFLKSIDIDDTLFFQILQHYDIEIVHEKPYDPLVLKTLLPDKTFSSSLSKSKLVWEDDWTQVFIPPQPRVPHHLWVVLKKEKGSFLDLSNEEALQLHSTLKKAIAALHNDFGYAQYVIAQFNQPQNDHFLNKVTIEIIPTPPNAKDILDFEDKIACNSYCTIRGLTSSKPPPLSDEDIETIAAQWKAAMQNLSPLPVLPKAQSVVYKNKNKKFAYLIEELFLALTKRGLQITKHVHDQHLHHFGNEQISKPINDQCPFCNPSILSKETIFEKGGITVLLNHMPFVKGAHFLLIPSKHRLHFTDLSLDEVLSLHETTQRFIHALKEKYGRSDVKMYIQEGYAAGQTVFHLHLHVFPAPDPIRQLFFGLGYDILPKVTPQEFQDVREEFAPLLKEFRPHPL